MQASVTVNKAHLRLMSKKMDLAVEFYAVLRMARIGTWLRVRRSLFL